MPDRTNEKLWLKIVQMNMLQIYPGKRDQCGKLFSPHYFGNHNEKV